MSTARSAHTAALLPSGKVLVVGGGNDQGVLKSAEVYDPATNSWSAAGSMGTARLYSRAALLPSGKVLVTGGDNFQSAALASAER
jgi:N-acetylneuraminic acid mutarotase